MWLRQKRRCGICKRQIRRRYLYTERVNVDHIRPRSHGGTNHPKNLHLVHIECNQEKADSCTGCPKCPR